jgi:hypothetical protein
MNSGRFFPAHIRFSRPTVTRTLKLGTVISPPVVVGISQIRKEEIGNKVKSLK